MAGAARRSPLPLLALIIVFLALAAQAFVVPKTSLKVTASSRRSGRFAVSQPLRALDSEWLSTVASPIPSSTLVADYFSTVDEIAAGIGNTPWLQFFIPTAVGMSIALAIVFSLYITAQPYEPPSK
ncbi:Hypothetical protein NocV09_00204270 [Nannochloropsis oceanica]